MGKIDYLDQDKNELKQLLLSLAEDLDNVSKVTVCFTKDNTLHLIKGYDVNSYDLMITKSNLEQVGIYGMIKENFVTPEE